MKLLWISTVEGIRFMDLGTQRRGVEGSCRVCEPVYCDGEVIEYDHPGVIWTGETTNGFSFFIIIVWFGIITAGVVAIGIITIGTIISRTIITRNIVLLVVIDLWPMPRRHDNDNQGGRDKGDKEGDNANNNNEGDSEGDNEGDNNEGHNEGDDNEGDRHDERHDNDSDTTTTPALH